MNGLRLASALLRSVWLVDERWAENNIALAQMILDGQSVASNSENLTAVLDRRLTKYQYREGWTNAARGSYALHKITGPILHYGWCDDGTHELDQAFKEAEANPNIAGHFLFMDTPGGQADGVKEFANTVRAANKPVIAFINGGMIASGGVWIASAADEIYASSELCQVGSIGAFSMLVDTSERDQREGVKRIIIKAKQSPDKNTVYELAKSGDKTALAELREEISFLAEHFIEAVKDGRGDRLTSEEWNTGKMYRAEKAIELGLIDGISTLEAAIDKLGAITKQSKNKNMSKFNNVAALSGKDQVTQEDLDLANADLTAEGITHVTLVEQSVIDEAARVTTELETANAQIEKANATIADHTATIQTQAERIKTLESVIANRAHEDNGAAVSQSSSNNSEIEDQPEQKVAAHNRIADQGVFR